MRILLALFALTLLTLPALAQEAATQPPAAPNPLPMVIFMIAIFYFLIWRPQSKMRKQHLSMVESLKRGDVVVTAGGIKGTITLVDGDTVKVEIAPGIEVEVVKSTLSSVAVRQGETKQPANDVKAGGKKKTKKK